MVQILLDLIPRFQSLTFIPLYTSHPTLLPKKRCLELRHGHISTDFLCFFDFIANDEICYWIKIFLQFVELDLFFISPVSRGVKIYMWSHKEELQQTLGLLSKSNTYFSAAVYTEYIMLPTPCLRWRHYFIRSLSKLRSHICCNLKVVHGFIIFQRSCKNSG